MVENGGSESAEQSRLGDVIAVQELISDGENSNSKNGTNGWTPLHWAAFNGLKEIVELLLENGAHASRKNERESTERLSRGSRGLPGLSVGELALSETSTVPPCTKCATLSVMSRIKKEFEMNSVSNTSYPVNNHVNNNIGSELVLKVRIANCDDPDFCEVELSRTELTFAQLVKVCCEELNVQSSQIAKVRKLPNTVLRKDKDVQRLTDYQEIEIVLSTTPGKAPALLKTPLSSTVNGNGYESIHLKKDQTVLY